MRFDINNPDEYIELLEIGLELADARGMSATDKKFILDPMRTLSPIGMESSNTGETTINFVSQLAPMSFRTSTNGALSFKREEALTLH